MIAPHTWHQLLQQLVPHYDGGFNHSALTRMIKFSVVFPDQAIVATLSRQLSWTHFIALIPLKQPLEREAYAEMCRIEHWSVRTLRDLQGLLLFSLPDKTTISQIGRFVCE